MKYRPLWFDFHSFVIVLMMACCANVHAQCDLGCHPGPLTIALGETGETLLEPSYFLAFRSSGCNGSDSVQIIGQQGRTVDCSMIGMQYTVRVTNVASGNYCETDILVVDRLDPELIIPADISIHCDKDYRDTSVTGSAMVTDNCSYDLIYSDNASDLNDCGLGDVIRTWKVTDEGGNTTQQNQIITIIDTIPPVVQFPPDITLHCDQDELDLSLTGVPLFSDNCGNLDDSYTDLPFDLCSPGTKRILRKWAVADFCDLNGQYGLIEHSQTITVTDTLAPFFNCAVNDTLGTDPSLSTRWMLIEGLNNLSDYCSGILVDTIVINSYGDTIDLVAGSGLLSLGENRIEFFVEDECENRDSCSRTVLIEDNEDPMIICLPSTNVSISTDTSYLFPEIFYRDVSDNATVDSNLKVVLVYNNVEYDSLAIDCSWVGPDLHDILVRVTDENGNFNQCQSSFYVHDISAPQIYCPSDITVHCGEDYSDSGDPGFYENCYYSLWYVDDASDLNSCGLGVLTRKWIIEDGEGLRDSCIQYIEIISDFVPSFTGPSDITINCGDSEHPSNTGEPSLTDSCSHLIWAFSDQESAGPPGIIKVIKRTFEIIDDCNSSFQEFYVQDIFVQDISEPELECEFDSVYYLPHESCEMLIEIRTNISDDCNLGINLSHDAGIGSFNNEIYSATFEKGQYLFNIYADDGLGNFDTSVIHFHVLDTFPPLSICRRGLSMNLGSDMILTPNPSLFDLGSSDNCTSYDDLIFRISPNSFDCWDQGENEITFTVIDESGNEAHCITDLYVQDPVGYCPPLEHFIEGQVLDGDYQAIYGIEMLAVIGNDTLSTETDEYGLYRFDAIPSGSNITVFPSNEGSAGLGLSTLDLILLRSHLLERTSFQRPYEYLAGDVNGSSKLSNLDITIMRGIILQNLTEWPGGENYGSIPYFREFGNPEEVLDMSSEEKRIEIIEILEDVPHADFIVVKTGDINNSAFEDGLLSRESCDSIFYFRTQEAQVESGDEVVLQLVSGIDFDLLGMQFILDIDPAFLEYIELDDISGIGLVDQTHYNYNDQSNQFILTWDRSPAVAISENSVILEIRFGVRSSFDWPEHIDISETEIVDDNFMGYDICTSEITSIAQFNGDIPSVGLYPNPVRDILHFEFESNYFFSTFDEIIISDIFGTIREVKNLESLHNQYFSLGNMDPGVYWVRLRNREGKQLQVGKFVKI